MFEVGQDVVVAQRQWPGVNKEGGPGRVSKINSDGTVAVAYIIGNRSEARVPLKYVRLLEQPEGPTGSTGGVQSRSATRSLRGARAVKAPKQFDETVARMSTSVTGPELPELAAGTPKFIHQQVKDMEKLISRIEKEDSYEIFRTELDPIEKLKGTEGAEGDEQNGGDADRSG
ncbi:unnamed protein product, partial [Ectocarpus sp. 8 AP-2014]